MSKSKNKLEEFFVYLIRNRDNGKTYVGVTSNVFRRSKQHSRAPTLLGRAIRKYGIETFDITILATGTEEYCYSVENKFIVEYRSRKTQHGYNVLEGGNRNPKNAPAWTEERREAARQRMIGNARAAGGKSRTGQLKSQDEIEKMKVSKQTNPRQFSCEDKRKISEFHTGRKRTHSTRKAISEALLGKQNALGSTRDEETRAKMSEATKRGWDSRRAKAAELGVSPANFKPK